MTAERAIYGELEREFRFSEGRAVYVVPPYGRKIGRALAEADALARHGLTIVCLVPFRPDTRWAHTYCRPWEVRLIRGRVGFGDAQGGAPFPSAVVVMGPEAERGPRHHRPGRLSPAAGRLRPLLSFTADISPLGEMGAPRPFFSTGHG